MTPPGFPRQYGCLQLAPNKCRCRRGRINSFGWIHLVLGSGCFFISSWLLLVGEMPEHVYFTAAGSQYHSISSSATPRGAKSTAGKGIRERNIAVGDEFNMTRSIFAVNSSTSIMVNASVLEKKGFSRRHPQDLSSQSISFYHDAGINVTKDSILKEDASRRIFSDQRVVERKRSSKIRAVAKSQVHKASTESGKHAFGQNLTISGVLRNAAFLTVPWAHYTWSWAALSREEQDATNFSSVSINDALGPVLGLNTLRNALLFGDSFGEVEGKDTLHRRLRLATGNWMNLLGDHIESSSSVIWFGCFDGPHPSVVPFVVAAEFPQASIGILHACVESANISEIGKLRDGLELQNLIMFSTRDSTGSGTCDDDDAVPDAWKTGCASRVEEFQNSCQMLVISPGALSSLLSTTLPDLAEEALARAIQLCENSLIIDDTLGDKAWQYHDYWSSPSVLVESALAISQATRTRVLQTIYQPNSLYFTARGKSVGTLVKMKNTSQSCTACRNANSFNLGLLRSVFTLPNTEAVRLYSNAVTKKSILSCIMGNDVEFHFIAGTLNGCDYSDLVARRNRMMSVTSIPKLVLSPGSDLQVAFNVQYNSSEKHDFQAQYEKSVQSLSLVRGIQSRLGHIDEPSQVNSGSAQRKFDRFLDYESDTLRRWWRHVKDVLSDRHESTFSAYIVGEDLGMVALRIARKYKQSTIVFKRDRKLTALERLATNVGSANLVTASSRFQSRIRRRQRYLNSDLFTYVFLSRLSIAKFLENDCTMQTLQRSVGEHLIQASSAAIVEIPRFAFLRQFFTVLGVSECAESFGAGEYLNMNEVEFIENALESADESRKVTLMVLKPQHYFLYSNASDPSSSYTPYSFAEDPITIKLTFSDFSGAPKPRIEPGSVAVSSLLRIGLTPRWRARLLRAYLDLPLWLARKPNHMSNESVYHALSSSQLRLGPGNNRTSVRCRMSSTVLMKHSISPPMILQVAGVSKFCAPSFTLNASVWDALTNFLLETPAEHRNGRFSFVEWGASKHSLALRVAKKFINATVVAVFGDNLDSALDLYKHAESCKNLLICAGVRFDPKMSTNMLESPELARYSFLALDDQYPTDRTSPVTRFLAAALDENTASLDTKYMTAALILASMTSFVLLPSPLHVSLAFNALFGIDSVSVITEQTAASHGLSFYDRELLEHLLLKAPIESKVLLTVRRSKASNQHGIVPAPLIRIDVMNITRSVHHHFDWSRDGHQRTYSMTIEPNKTASLMVGSCLAGSRMIETLNIESLQGQGIIALNSSCLSRHYHLPNGHHLSSNAVLNVYLLRHEDNSRIPYNTVRSITLVAGLRLGLISPQQKAAFARFVRLPLFEDMAPWNIAFKGAELDYIDYDTRKETFDVHVRKVYQVLSSLMNYKRTVQDFGMCGSKAKTQYGFSLVADCVKPASFNGACSENAQYPVPCDDGRCHTDFISCLRSISSSRLPNEQTKLLTVPSEEGYLRRIMVTSVSE